MEADQLRWEDTNISKERSSSAMTPFPSADSSARYSRSDIFAEARPRNIGSRVKTDHFIVGVIQRRVSYVAPTSIHSRLVFDLYHQPKLSLHHPGTPSLTSDNNHRLMGNHGLLLRLLESKSFFTVHAALQYLKLYSDNVGITYYLTRRLREIDIQELREVWGFIWYSPTIVHVITPGS